LPNAEASTFSLKDALVLVPALSSALAVSWEVGSFLPIGGSAFSLFTLTEHLAFAATALPIAALMACFTCVMWIGAPLMVEFYLTKMKQPLERVSLIVRLGGVALGLYLIAFGIYVGVFPLSILGSAVALGAAAAFLPKFHFPRSLGALGLISFSMLLAMSFGADETRMQLNKNDLFMANFN
jgi:hypothetical protein